ncbi:MAG: hypothetical protein BJ554DRAFT_8356 [Olpidium bornovanus]|uniref:E3 ubiquitin-protein ligase n=1 Tax=Olpidium bornovanus TaxID=278681 RepID=A0A8H7ZUJ8_9FUNG|nr:MAG: hypothetical protein BJ554DRAFT_8356 [Olpidium bornovanus]
MLRVVCETLFTYTTLAASDDYAAYERIKAASASRFLLFTYSCGVTRGSASAEAPEDGRVLVAAKPWVHRDAFSVLVKMCMSDVVVGKWGAHRLVLVAFVADIVKTVLAVAESVIPSNSAESDKPDFGKWAKNPRVMSLLAGEYGPPNEDVTALVHFVRWVLESAGYSPPFVETFLTDQVPPRLLFKFVQAHSTPFLRKCAAFLYARFGVTYAGRRAADGAPELERLMHHLAVPPYRVLLAASGDPPRLLCGLRKLVACWLRHHVDHRSASGAAPQRRLRLGYPGVYSLVRLPARLDQLYEASLHVKCPKCRTVPLNPAFCLMCGRVLCTQSHCCMDGDNGECHMHGRA